MLISDYIDMLLIVIDKGLFLVVVCVFGCMLLVVSMVIVNFEVEFDFVLFDCGMCELMLIVVMVVLLFDVCVIVEWLYVLCVYV